MSAKTRLYKVKQESTGAVRLIEATTPSGARSFVARQDYLVTVPAQHEVFALAKSGIEIEIVGAEEVSIETRAALAQTCIEGA